jgi:hypothetical protein
MDIFIKASSSSFGADIGDIFSISADSGNAIPNQITKNELISGKILSVDQNASKLIILSNSPCSSQIEVIVNKDNSTCYAADPNNFTSGNNRPTDQDGNPASFDTEPFDALKIQEIKSKTELDTFALTIFGKNISFSIDLDTIDDDDESLIKGGVGNSGTDTFNFYFIENLDLDLNFTISSENTNISYKITGSPTLGYQTEKWLTSDFISF